MFDKVHGRNFDPTFDSIFSCEKSKIKKISSTVKLNFHNIKKKIQNLTQQIILQIKTFSP